MESLKEVLMRRDELTEEEADDQIREASIELQQLLDEDRQEEAHDICQTLFGLEPDYLVDLLLI